MRSFAREIANRQPILRRVYKQLPLLGVTRKSRLIAAVRSYTVMQDAKLSAIYELTSRLERAHMTGSFVECGVLNGGSAALIASVARRNKARHVWLFDSWEGFPETTPDDFSIISGKPGHKGNHLGSEETVRRLLFTAFKLDERQIHLRKGWFKDTLPAAKRDIGQIAFLLLDCNLYDSYKVCLRELYDIVIPGGVIFIDDYGSWKGCRKALEEFLEQRKLNVTLTDVWVNRRRTNRAVYFYKGER